MPEELRAPVRAGNDRFLCCTKLDPTGVEPAEDQHGSIRGTSALACSEQQIRVASGDRNPLRQGTIAAQQRDDAFSCRNLVFCRPWPAVSHGVESRIG